MPEKILKPDSENPENQPAIVHPEPVEITEEMLKEAGFEKAEFKAEKPKEEKFELKEAIQDKDFFNFLAEYAPENIEALDAAEIEKFQEAYKASKEIKNFYKDIIEKDTGVKLEDKDFRTLEVYFVNQIYTNPAELKQARQFLREFYTLPEIIAGKEKQFADLGGQEAIELAKARVYSSGLLLDRKNMLIEQLEKKRELSKDVHGFRGFILLNNWPILGKFFRTKEEEEAYQKTTEEWRKEINALNSEIKSLTEEKEKYQEIQKEATKLDEELATAKDKAEALTHSFLQGGFEPAKNIFDITKEKLKQRIAVVADPNRASIKDLEKGLEEVQKLSTTEIVKFTDTELKGFEKQINDALEYKVSSEIVEKLEKMPISKIGPLRAVDELVSQYFKKEKIGSKTKRQEIEELVKKALLQYIKKTKPEAGETPQSFKAKKIAAKLLILQMEYVG